PAPSSGTSWLTSPTPAAAAAPTASAAPEISAAERQWYAKMGVDPYSDNPLLHEIVASYSRIEGLASYGMRFGGLPAVPGGDALQPALERVWKSEPQALRDANRQQLVADGVPEAQARALESNAALTPTQQTAIVLAIDQLSGVEGRDQIVARAADVRSAAEAIDLLRATLML